MFHYTHSLKVILFNIFNNLGPITWDQVRNFPFVGSCQHSEKLWFLKYFGFQNSRQGGPTIINPLYLQCRLRTSQLQGMPFYKHVIGHHLCEGDCNSFNSANTVSYKLGCVYFCQMCLHQNWGFKYSCSRFPSAFKSKYLFHCLGRFHYNKNNLKDWPRNQVPELHLNNSCCIASEPCHSLVVPSII